MYLFLSVLFSLFFPSQIFAQEATVTPVSEKNLTEEVRDMVTKKVKEIQQSDTNNSSTTIPKSIIGTITKIEENKITVNYKNENKTIVINTETTFTDAKKKTIKLSNLTNGQVILAMGYYNQNNNLEAKKIIITTLDVVQNKNEIAYGTIADISQTSNILVLIPLKNKNTQYQIKIDTKTKIVDKDNNILTISKLKSGQKIVVVIQPDAKIANTFDGFNIITIDSITTATSPTPTPKK